MRRERVNIAKNRPNHLLSIFLRRAWFLFSVLTRFFFWVRIVIDTFVAQWWKLTSLKFKYQHNTVRHVHRAYVTRSTLEYSSIIFIGEANRMCWDLPPAEIIYQNPTENVGCVSHWLLVSFDLFGPEHSRFAPYTGRNQKRTANNETICLRLGGNFGL